MWNLPIKAYLYAALLAAIAGGGFWFNGKLNDNKRLESENIQLIIELQNQKDIVTIERKNAAEANAREKETVTAKKVIEDAYNDKLKCIANSTCGVQIRWKAAICSGVSGANASESGLDDRTRSDLADLSRWDANVERSINKNYQLIKDLQREYAIKSDPNYCKSK